MKKTRDILKKFFAVIIAASLVFVLAPEVLADEAEGSQGIDMTEVPEGNTESEEKLAVGVDLSELESTIAYANGLNKREYSKQSWEELEKSIAAGLELLSGEAEQQEVDAAVAAIDAAVAALVEVDYSKLEKALGVLYNIMDENSVQRDLWARIESAVEDARAILISGNQESVDKTTELLDALAQEFLENGELSPEPEIVVNTVEVEVPPSDDFCNIPGHKVWTVLFFLSLALNLGLIGAGAYIFIRKRNTEDNIPLVNYDIDEDFDDFDDFEDEIEEEYESGNDSKDED